MEKHSKRGDLSNRTSRSDNEGKSALGHERGKKRKGSDVSAEVPKRSRSGAQPGPSAKNGNEKATRSAATTRGINTPRKAPFTYKDDTIKDGGGSTKTEHHRGTHTSDARPVKPRSVVDDDILVGEDLPEPNLRRDRH
ncbi:uncharacterized protein LOC128220468 [Mya arenaria]|uniref:uncharacterized protein LOC128220468 n=1 Tax=Mya arenaria TaxID=6604 RepID=UPI0022DF5610|nr:uncharacterized protein LOC128220468 [Mya arenaria]